MDEAIAIKKEVLGINGPDLCHEHLDTISATVNVSNKLGEQDNINEARSTKKDLLEKERLILDEEEEEVDTTSVMNDIAHILDDLVALLSDQEKIDEGIKDEERRARVDTTSSG
jgi:hypothetical protein